MHNSRRSATCTHRIALHGGAYMAKRASKRPHYVVCDTCDMALPSSEIGAHRESTHHAGFVSLTVARREGWLPLQAFARAVTAWHSAQERKVQ